MTTVVGVPHQAPATTVEETTTGRSNRSTGRVGGTPAYLVCFLAFILANMFSGNSGRLGFPIGPDRLLFLAGAVLLLLDSRPRALVRLRWRGIHTAMLAFVVVAAFSTWASGSYRNGYALYGLLDVVVIPFVLFAIAPAVFADSHSRDLLLKVLTVVALYLGFTAVFEVVGPQSLVWPRYVIDPSIGIQFGRARGPFVESEANGMTMAMAAIASGSGVSRFRGAWRPACVLACAMAAVGVLLSLTRSVWIGFAVAAIATFVFARPLRRFLVPLLVLGTLAVVALLAVVPGLSESASGRADAQGPVWDRLNTNAAAVRIIEQEPLTGIGWLNFIPHSPEWVRQAPDYPITAINIEIHNVFLSRAAEVGLVGAGLYVLCLLGGPVGAVVRRAPAGDLGAWRVVVLGVLIIWLSPAMASPLTYPLPNALLWLVAGLGSVGHIARITPERPPGPVRHLA